MHVDGKTHALAIVVMQSEHRGKKKDFGKPYGAKFAGVN